MYTNRDSRGDTARTPVGSGKFSEPRQSPNKSPTHRDASAEAHASQKARDKTPRAGEGQTSSAVVDSPTPKRKLLDQVRDKRRTLHYAKRTEEAYVDWIRRYIVFHGLRHSSELGAAEVAAFLTHLAVERNVAASTQNQALAGILFLHRQILQVGLPLIHAVRCFACKNRSRCTPLT